ncbi:MAG: peptidylprolyl isomerase, partial [Candidatus Marinimicrobia bacterium]|nr:peptidylprolyl isomerase [Candidatus Neomarinimicrobiota bacterium]
MKAFKLLALIFIAIIAVSCSKEEEGKYIADVNGNIITKNEFKNCYTEYLKMTELKDNIKLRYDVLRMMVDEKILLKYADTSGFIQKPEIRNLLNLQQDQIYLNYYFENYIYPELKVTEAEMREAFRRSKIKIHARHLYTSGSIKAKQLKEKLDAGETFELLAQLNFKDPVLASNGGDIGWFSYGEIDPAFENIAYKLSPGEISNPIKTRNGYS